MFKPAILAVLFWIVAAPSFAQQSPGVDEVPDVKADDPLPDPLTLADALRLAASEYPTVARYAADRTLARSRVSLAQSRYDVEATVRFDARAADKAADADRRFRDDSRATLYLSKLLSDFGVGRAVVAAAEARQAGAELALDYQRKLHDIDIMARFLDVKLADLRYFVDDEDMTLAFLRYDRVRERRELFGEFAEVDEKGLEAVFRDRLVTRTRSAQNQRLARNRLALAMGRPGELADNVLLPQLHAYDRPPPEYDEILEEVLAHHPLLQVNALLLEAADHAIRALQYADRPELTARLEATEWSLERGNRDQYVAGLELEFALGGKAARNARLAEAMAEREYLEVDRKALEYELRQTVLELVQSLRALTFEEEAARVNEDYRDLYLDRSRSLYQLEVRSDLGDSQARQAEAVWRSTRVGFDRALTWARIDAMRNMPLAVHQPEESQ
ncbi:MAG: TolC family protein [Proteobacteria bacterium]|nr:MAG: TolC family protein [Pseudomonadota bacterium]